MKSRRQFLQGCSLAIAAMSGSRLSNLFFRPEGALPDAHTYWQAGSQETLIVVFLRGGWDGLSVVMPTGSDDRKWLEQARPGIKIPENRLLALNDQFGMHPALAPLRDLYQAGKAAWVHAVGLNVDTRSHFDAQEFIELGTPGNKSTTTGWITRHLQSVAGALTGSLPVAAYPSPSSALLNAPATVSLNDIGDLNLWDSGYREDQQAALQRLYVGDTALHQAGQRTLEVIQSLAPYIDQAYTPSRGVKYADDDFSKRMMSIARLIKMGLGLQIATVDFGGWDTHQYQNDGAGGYLSNLLSNLGAGLSNFYLDLQQDGYAKNTSVIVLSEFGRRLVQNDSQGTDHGHGSLMLALGDGVNGGKVFGQWPGLANDQLYDHADLAVTTDFRQVLGELLMKRLHTPNLAQVFPGFQMTEPLGLFTEKTG